MDEFLFELGGEDSSYLFGGVLEGDALKKAKDIRREAARNVQVLAPSNQNWLIGTAKFITWEGVSNSVKSAIFTFGEGLWGSGEGALQLITSPLQTTKVCPSHCVAGQAIVDVVTHWRRGCTT